MCVTFPDGCNELALATLKPRMGGRALCCAKHTQEKHLHARGMEDQAICQILPNNSAAKRRKMETTAVEDNNKDCANKDKAKRWGRRYKLDPGLKAPLFQNFDLIKRKRAFNLNLVL